MIEILVKEINIKLNDNSDECIINLRNLDRENDRIKRVDGRDIIIVDRVECFKSIAPEVVSRLDEEFLDTGIMINYGEVYASRFICFKEYAFIEYLNSHIKFIVIDNNIEKEMDYEDFLTLVRSTCKRDRLLTQDSYLVNSFNGGKLYLEFHDDGDVWLLQY